MNDRLTAILSQKHHWSTSAFRRGGISLAAIDDGEPGRSYRAWITANIQTTPALRMFVEEGIDLDAFEETDHVIRTCMEGLVRWHRYRDAVAVRMGFERDAATTAPPPVVSY